MTENFHRWGSASKYGLPKERKCMNCGKAMQDDGSLLWLRGFHSEECRQAYLDHFKK